MHKKAITLLFTQVTSLFLLVALGCFANVPAWSATPPAPASAQVDPIPTVTYPIELMGDGNPNKPIVNSLTLGLNASDLANVDKIQVRCHRCGFYDAPEFEATVFRPAKIKASMRVLGLASQNSKTPWLDITDATITLTDTERVQGGLNGSLYTITFTIPVDTAMRTRLTALPALNTIQFRFNGTDGNSSGFRILNVRFLSKTGQNLTKVTEKWADIKAEKLADKVLSTDVSAGEKLWYAENILKKSTLVKRRIHASCSACHDVQGRDLQYFNYSDHSIVQRSRFHGLSEAEGKQIAAFLRYSLRKMPHVAQAAPWNPPYQPGPRTSCTTAKCQTTYEWAAGSGIDAVTKTPAESLEAWTSKKLTMLTQADLDNAMDPHRQADIQGTKIPLQMPDWNAWLPHAHPMDIWPDEKYENTKFAFSSGPDRAYSQARTWLETNKNPNGKYGDWTHLTDKQKAQLMHLLGNVNFSVGNFNGGGRERHISPDPSKPFGSEKGADTMQSLLSAQTAANYGYPNAFSRRAFVERATNNIFHWMAVKDWELAFTYGLNLNNPYSLGKSDLKDSQSRLNRQWPVSIFNVAPHIMANDAINFDWHSNHKVADLYQTNQWYILQIILNGKSDDWPYVFVTARGVPDHAQAIAETNPELIPASKAVANNYRILFLEMRQILAHLSDNDIPLNYVDPKKAHLEPYLSSSGYYSKAKMVNQLSPSGFLDSSTGNFSANRNRGLDQVLPGLYKMVVNASIAQFNALYSVTNPADWRRCDPNYRPSWGSAPEPNDGMRFCLDQKRSPQFYYGPKYAGGTMANIRFLPGGGVPTTDQNNVYGIWAAERLGVESQRLKVWSDWVNWAWPDPTVNTQALMKSLTQALKTYKAKGNNDLTQVKATDLFPLLGGTGVDQASKVDFYPLFKGTLQCSSKTPCLRFKDGSLLYTAAAAFPGDAANQGISYIYDADGKVTGINDSIQLTLYADGTVRTRGTLKNYTTYRNNIIRGPEKTGDPSWYKP